MAAAGEADSSTHPPAARPVPESAPGHHGHPSAHNPPLPDDTPSKRPLSGLRSLYTGATSFRSRLRGRQKAPSTATSVSSLPVIVRTYSAEDRPSQSNSAALTAAGKGKNMATLVPPVSDFSFDGILRAVEPDISGAIDAIAAICARSKFSLADEYAAHRPPHEVLETPVPYPQPQRLTRWWTTGGNALAPLPEASSSSERLAGSHKDSESSNAGKSRKNSAYGSLKSIVSGEGKGGLAALFGSGEADRQQDERDNRQSSRAVDSAPWIVWDSSHPSITLTSGPAASAHLSLATSDQPCRADAVIGSTVPTPAPTSVPSPTARRSERERASSLSTWLPWPRQQQAASAPVPVADGSNAEQKLKELLRAPSSGQSKAVTSYG